MMQPGDVAALSAFAEAARQIRLPFFVVGSVASSLHGIPRMTQDVDVVALLRRDHIGGLCAALGTDWYAAEEAMEEALRFRSSFNAIHYPSGVKIDVFVGGHRPYDDLMYLRAMDVQLDPGATPIAVASAEDVVVQKLLGFKASNRVLSRQLDDIRGVLRTQGDRFDWSYALEQAEALGVRDLAESCRAELR